MPLWPAQGKKNTWLRQEGTRSDTELCGCPHTPQISSRLLSPHVTAQLGLCAMGPGGFGKEQLGQGWVEVT